MTRDDVQNRIHELLDEASQIQARIAGEHERLNEIAKEIFGENGLASLKL